VKTVMIIVLKDVTKSQDRPP